MQESRAGQLLTARWFESITTEDGQEKRVSNEGKEFWCMELQPSQTTKQFRDGIEGKGYSSILGSTNHSKLNGIQDKGGQVLYAGAKRNIVYVQYLNGKYTIALS